MECWWREKSGSIETGDFMKRHTVSRIIPVTVFVLALASPDISQSDDFERSAARKPATVEEELLKRVHRDAIKRLSLLPNRCRGIADPAARARVQARIADALWQRDEAR